MAAATAADPKESHHGFVEGTGRYGRAASGRSAGLEPRDWDRVVPGGDGADIGEPLNYATTEIPVKVEHPSTVCGAEEWRGVWSGTE